MLADTNTNTNDCVECFKIKCRNCGWEPSIEQEKQVLSGLLAKCPDCGGGK